LLYCVIIGVVDNYRKYQWVTLALILGALYWGVDAYLDPKFSDGRLIEIGGPDSFNDNAAAAHVIPILPFLALYLWTGSKWQKVVALVAAPFIVNLVILCNSRGATIGIVVAMLAGVLLMQWRLRLRLALVVLMSLPVVLSLVNQDFILRQLTLVQFLREGPRGPATQDDSAANDRVRSWEGAIELMGARPLGVGGGGWDLLSPTYAPEVVEEHAGELRAVHNTYLWAGADWGVSGLIAFLGFIGSGLLALHRIRRETMNERFKLESLALEIGLIAFLGAAVFVNRMYAEILYWLIALSAALTNIHDAEARVARDSLEPHAPAAARAA
jgi:O-antigen ligase